MTKQTDNLIKLANTIQKIHASELAGESDSTLSEVERNELFSHLEDANVDPLTQRHKKETRALEEKKKKREMDAALTFNPKSAFAKSKEKK